MLIRPTAADEADALASVHRAAFGADLEADLARDLMRSPEFLGHVSFAAEEGGCLVGHVLFTRAWLECDGDGVRVPLLMLAPLAVVPGHQRTGVGTVLVEAAIALACEDGETAVLVFGDPAYYGRFGFSSAVPYAIRMPYPIEPLWGWQVLAFAPERLGSGGVLHVAGPLDLPELWLA